MEGYQPIRKKIYEHLGIEKPQITDINEMITMKTKMFECLNSDDEDLFFVGVHTSLYILDDVLTDEDRERIRNIVIKKRRLFRKQRECLGYYSNNIGDWAELCDMLDIEMTKDEIEIFLQALNLSPEDKKTMMEQIKKARKIFKLEGNN